MTAGAAGRTSPARAAPHRRPVRQAEPITVRPFVLPAVVLGVGLGAFVDGIVLHQVLGWHHMTSAVDPPISLEALERNTVADGILHAFAWLATLAGVALLWRAAGLARRRAPVTLLAGGLLTGFAAFNLVEGTVNHLLLGVHHVREGPDAFAYDAGFLVASALVFVLGSWLLRRGLRPPLT